jgi:hypothetical protein
MGLLKLFNKKENTQGQDLNALKERFNQLQGVANNSNVSNQNANPITNNNNNNPITTTNNSNNLSDLDSNNKSTVNIVEVEEDKETSKEVPIGDSFEDDSAFEDVILSQDNADDIEAKKKEEEISKRSIASYLDEIKENYEDAKLISLVIKQVKELIEIDNNLNKKITEVEVTIKNEVSEREKLAKSLDETKKEIKGLEKNMEKFIALYELVTNQFNPFIEKQDQNLNLQKIDIPKIEPKPAVKEEEEENNPPPASAAQELFRKLQKKKKESAQAQTKEEINPEVKEQKTMDPVLAQGSAVAQDNNSVMDKEIDKEVQNQETQATAIIKKIQESQKVQNKTEDTSSNISSNNNEAKSISEIKDPSQLSNNNNNNNISITQKQTKKLPEHLHFVLKDGSRIDSLSSLLNFFNENDDSTIFEYVTHYKNEFAGWIYETFHNDSLSQKLASCKTRPELIQALSDYIEKNH